MAAVQVETGGAVEKKSGDAASGAEPRRKRKYRSRARQRSPQTIQRAKRVRRSKANDRERNRMHSLNDALEQLRETLPIGNEDGKLTKIETLRHAHDYIARLSNLLKMPDDQLVALTQPVDPPAACVASPHFHFEAYLDVQSAAPQPPTAFAPTSCGHRPTNEQLFDTSSSNEAAFDDFKDISPMVFNDSWALPDVGASILPYNAYF